MNKTSEHSSLVSISYLLIGFLSLLIAFPLFIFVHKQFPDYGWPFHTDRILMFFVILVFALLMLQLFRPVIFLCFIAALAWLSFGSFTGNYGFESLFTDYKAMMYTFKYQPYNDEFSGSGGKKFFYKKEILEAIDDNSSAVRAFAVKATTSYFRREQSKYEGYRTLIQSFAVFKRINRNWNYVSDPVSNEYFAKASESAKLLAGDCDDYAIMMAAAIKSIGGVVRLVSTTDHLYPEILVGNKSHLEFINYLIKKILFPIESAGQVVHYHKDELERIWLNLDYTASYPGGKFLAEPILGILNP